MQARVAITRQATMSSGRLEMRWEWVMLRLLERVSGLGSVTNSRPRDRDWVGGAMLLDRIEFAARTAPPAGQIGECVGCGVGVGIGIDQSRGGTEANCQKVTAIIVHGHPDFVPGDDYLVALPIGAHLLHRTVQG